MNPTFDTYFDAIGLTKTFRERIKVINFFYEQLCPEVLQDVFVTDYVAEEEGRRFENVWFFSEHFIMEAKKFASQDDYDIVYAKPLERMAITKNDYDFVKATENSRMTVDWSTPRLKASLRASSENCDFLKALTVKYFLPLVA
jgi:hypothetical protein